MSSSKNIRRQRRAFQKMNMAQTVQRIEGNRFQDEVMKSDTPVVVDFYADWCGPCKIISPILDQLAKEYSGRVKFVKIDTDTNQELATQFGIMSIPTVMMFSKGRVDDIVIGAVPPAVFKTKIDSLLKP